MSGAYKNALAVLLAAEPSEKVHAANHLASEWTLNQILGDSTDSLPETPFRPKKPEMVSPSEVKRRRLGTLQGRIALLHAVAHIEFNAIDLAADMIARFGPDMALNNQDRYKFISDWIGVCHDEARHFGLVNDRLAELGVSYGDLPAHNGLWEAAIKTKHEILARLAIAPMVLEARGLDVTPFMIKKLKNAGDESSAALLQVIYNDEIGHVAVGTYWFKTIAKAANHEPKEHFRYLVDRYFAGALKPPFNTDARKKAGMARDLYEPLVIN